MPYAKLHDCQLHYVEAGTGTPIIFLHGFTLDHRQWTRQVGFFSGDKNRDGFGTPGDHAYRAIALDSRGHGKSDAPATGYSRAHRVEDLKQFIDILGIDQFHLVGLSMGGTTGIGFAFEHADRLKSLTLVSSSAAGVNIGKKISKIDQIARTKGIEAARDRWIKMTLSFYNKAQADIAKQMTEMVTDHSGAIWIDESRGKYTREEDFPRLDQIDLPTLIMCGQIDKVFHEIGEEIHNRVKNSRFLSYSDVGHMINLEIPEQFNTDLKAFIKAVE